MALIKFVSPSGWDFDQRILEPIKVSSRGLIGADRSEFLKRASHAFLPSLDNIKFAKDEVPVHLIALGASEAYGPNRNGDGFKEATCRQHHDTFVKFAKFFRNHKNKAERGDPFFGVVKASAYNEDMRRVELLCALNAEKSAVDRNGGFVADTELEKIARGEDMPVSMACRVPHDVCSFCKHAARNRDEYCTTEKCAAGGCRENLTRLVKVAGDLHHLHVDNPNPTWFDISRVFRPADRIAYGAKADYLTKAASDQGIFEFQDYIKMAEHSTAPLDVILYQSGQHGFWSEKHAAQIRLGYGLAALEKINGAGDATTYRAVATPAFPVEKLAAFGTVQCDTQLAALADRKIILNLRDYARLSGREANVKSAASILPGIYTRMTNDESLPLRVESGACAFIEKTANGSSRMLAATLTAEHSLSQAAVMDRSFLSCIREQPAPAIIVYEKSASCDDVAEGLAKDYAMYKLASLWRLAAADADFPLTVKLSLRQNQVFN
jgi:hypothetical protein